VSEVATEYLTQLRLREAKAIAQQTLETVQRSYQLIRKRFELGAASELELRTAEGQVETVRVNAAAFLQQLAESQNALAQLIGQPVPKDLPPGIPFDQQQLLGPVPAGIPSDALEKRPDILAAEHTLKAANANIGAARAAYFPQILLTGSGGLASTTLDNLFTGPARTWSYGPQLNVPIFNYGSTQAKVAASKIQGELEVTDYQKAIQTAFREVADALATRGILDQKLKAQERLLAAQRRRFDLTEARYRQGVDGYVEVLLAQQDLYSAQQNLLQFQVARLVNAITLYRSLGGGWKS
jgi:multidrug efflux system outer membrane protein